MWRFDPLSLLNVCFSSWEMANTFPLSLVLATLLAPLGAHHRVFQRVCVKLAPALQRLDFSIHGYMMSKPIDNQCKPLHLLVCAPEFTKRDL